jgi:hypothetical protein
MPSERHIDLDITPGELPRVVRALRGVRDLVLHADSDGSPLRLEVLVESREVESPHWLALLHRTVVLLARSAFGRPVDVVLSPHDDDLDASLDR